MELQTFTSFQFCIVLVVWSANGDAPFQGKFQVNLLNDDTEEVGITFSRALINARRNVIRNAIDQLVRRSRNGLLIPDRKGTEWRVEISDTYSRML